MQRPSKDALALRARDARDPERAVMGEVQRLVRSDPDSPFAVEGRALLERWKAARLAEKAAKAAELEEQARLEQEVAEKEAVQRAEALPMAVLERVAQRYGKTPAEVLALPNLEVALAAFVAGSGETAAGEVGGG